MAKCGVQAPQPIGGKKKKGRNDGQQESFAIQPIGGKNQKRKGAKGSGKGALQQAVAGQYAKLKGTSIRTLADGRVVRIIGYDQKQYAPNDIRGAESHLAKAPAGGAAVAAGGKGARKKGKKQQQEVQVKGKGKGKKAKGKGRGKGEDSTGPGKKVKKKLKLNKMARSAKKELTPEQQEERDQKRAERNESRIAEEGRVVVTTEHIAGEVVSRGKFFAWVKPLNAKAIPADVAAKLKTMNDEFKAKANENGKKKFCGGIDTDVVYVRLADVEQGFQLKPDVKCKFKLYTDSKGVGGCEVIAA